MAKVVMKLDLHDDKERRKAMKAISNVSGIDSMTMDMKEKKMTVVGEADPVKIVGKLRKLWRTELVSFGPAKEEKKPEPKPNELAMTYYPSTPVYYHYYPPGAEETPYPCVIS